MKLFLVHTWYYDNNISNGFYESHTNYFVVAEDIKEAKTKIKGIDEFKHKKMHISMKKCKWVCKNTHKYAKM